MPKLAKGLTVKQLESAKANTTLSDGNGLSLVVDANLNKRWVFRYTRPDGRRNWLGIGSYPVVPLLKARKDALIAGERIAEGLDPSNLKKEAKQAVKAIVRGTFKAVAEEWYTNKSRSWASETARKARETLDDNLYPKLERWPSKTEQVYK